MTRHDRPMPPPLCPSRPVQRRAKCVLEHGNGPDPVLGALLWVHPNLTLREAIEGLSAQGW